MMEDWNSEHGQLLIFFFSPSGAIFYTFMLDVKIQNPLISPGMIVGSGKEVLTIVSFIWEKLQPRKGSLGTNSNNMKKNG